MMYSFTDPMVGDFHYHAGEVIWTYGDNALLHIQRDLGTVQPLRVSYVKGVLRGCVWLVEQRFGTATKAPFVLHEADDAVAFGV